MATQTAPTPDRGSRSAVKIIREIPTAIAGLGVLSLMLHTLANAIGRSFNEPFKGTLEIAQFWYMPAIILLGFSVAVRRGEHVEASLVYDRMPAGAQRFYHACALVVMAALSAVLAYFGLLEALEVTEIRKTSGTTGITVWPAFWLVPLGFGLMFIYLVLALVRPSAQEVDHV